MRKKTLLLIVALAVIAVGIGGTISYFTSRDTADNVFTVGDVKIELTEPKWDPAAEHIIAKDAVFDKDPTVKNTGDNDAYVRVNVTVRDCVDVADAIGMDASDELETLFSDGIDHAKWIPADPNRKVVDGDITFTYMYRDILKVGDRTGALFEKVTFPNTVDMDKVVALPGDGVTIDVTADAIQAEGFDSAEDAFKAFDNN